MFKRLLALPDADEPDEATKFRRDVEVASVEIAVEEKLHLARTQKK